MKRSLGFVERIWTKNRDMNTLPKTKKLNPNMTPILESESRTHGWKICAPSPKTVLHGSSQKTILWPVFTCDFCHSSSCDFSAILVRNVAAIWRGFPTWSKLAANWARQKLYRVAATEIASVNGPFINYKSWSSKGSAWDKFACAVRKGLASQLCYPGLFLRLSTRITNQGLSPVQSFSACTHSWRARGCWVPS